VPRCLGGTHQQDSSREATLVPTAAAPRSDDDARRPANHGVGGAPPLLRRPPPGAARLRAVQLLRHHPAGNISDFDRPRALKIKTWQCADDHTDTACIRAGGRAVLRRRPAAEDGGRAVRQLRRHPLRHVATVASGGVRRATTAGHHRF
jgi:hypothetical protein